MARIKICGITNPEDALFAADLGVDALGFVFYPQSPRNIEPKKARKIIQQLPPFLAKVGVFINETAAMVNEIIELTGIDVVQLHGQEAPEYCQRFERKVIKAFRIAPDFDPAQIEVYKVDAYLLDTYVRGVYGGTGEVFNWEIAKRAKQYGRIILAGGLNPENIKEAIRQVEPYGVDISSGVEIRPGEKDKRKLEQLVLQVRSTLVKRN
jgi:phosphoribosylanthranilate isomerase